ncbi:MAG: YjbF family lipoprotein [Rhizomicrobium sp.]
MTRRGHGAAAARTLACLAALALAGCGSADSNVGWDQVYDMFSGGFGGSSSVTLEQAASVPYATLGVRVGDGPEAMVVLAGQAGGDLLWTSRARIAVTTRHGRIVKTSGLPRNIDSLYFPAGDPILDAARGGPPIESTRMADFWDLNRYSVPLRCVAVSRGTDPVTILGKTIATTRVDETCEGSTMDWSFTDSFWVGSNGLVWKSIQHYHPDYDPLELEILRPPAGMF